MALKNQAAENAVRALAVLTGESLTTAVRLAAEERLSKLRRAIPLGEFAGELLDIGRRCLDHPPGISSKW